MSIRTKEDRAIVSIEAQKLSQIDGHDRDSLVEFVKNVMSQHPFTYFSILKGKRFKKAWDDICLFTQFLDKHFQPNAATRIYYYTSKINSIHVCEMCGKPYTKQINAVNPNLLYMHCSAFCAQRNPKVSQQIKSTKVQHGTTTRDLLEKTKQRNRKKYGVDWYYQSKEFEEKKLAAWKAHGYDHPMQSDGVKNGMRDRYEQKYGKGIRWNFQSPDVKKKLNDHFRDTLGVDWPMQSKDVRDKIHANGAKTARKNFYESTLARTEGFDILTSKDDYVNMDRDDQGVILKWKCRKCGEVFDQSLYQYGKMPRCLKCSPLLYNRSESQEEIDLFSFLKTVDGSKYDCLRHSYWNWSLLDNGKLLDIVCIDKESKEPKIAIEFNGVYWHSIANKDPGYHLLKTKKCEEIGIKLIHIWEDEWINSKDSVKAFLEKVMKNEYRVDTSEDVIELDRSRLCKLWVPSCYTIVEETAPELREHRTKDTKRYAIEDCGKLVCRKNVELSMLT